MVELASATSTEEFKATLLKARSIPDSDNTNHSNAESSESNTYLYNGDMCAYVGQLPLSSGLGSKTQGK
ncbi:hypothetical protein CR513_31103, partial [Mucuna pruriens]